MNGCRCKVGFINERGHCVPDVKGLTVARQQPKVPAFHAGDVVELTGANFAQLLVVSILPLTPSYADFFFARATKSKTRAFLDSQQDGGTWVILFAHPKVDKRSLEIDHAVDDLRLLALLQELCRACDQV